MFENFKSKVEKQSIIALMLELAVVDRKKIDPIESKFIEDVTKQLGLSDADLSEVLSDPAKFKFVPPKGEQDRMSILYYMMFLCRVDGIISEKEEQLLHKISFRLGFNQNMTADLLLVMKEYLNKEIPPNAMLDKVKPYMN